MWQIVWSLPVLVFYYSGMNPEVLEMMLTRAASFEVGRVASVVGVKVVAQLCYKYESSRLILSGIFSTGDLLSCGKTGNFEKRRGQMINKFFKQW